MSEEKSNRPTHSLVVPPATEGGKVWSEVGVAWEKTDANGETFFSISIPLLGGRYLLRTKKYFDKDESLPKTGAKFRARKPKTVTDDEIDF